MTPRYGFQAALKLDYVINIFLPTSQHQHKELSRSMFSKLTSIQHWAAKKVSIPQRWFV